MAAAGSSRSLFGNVTKPGYALQAGNDYKIDEHWSLNLDVNKVFVETDIKVNGGAINPKGTDLDPLIVSVGVGFTF